MLNGMINVYKEAGYTSHDVVAKLRGILRQKKIGHTGTLDPGAVGVLPVCLGKATKACSILEDYEKSYRATLLLGLTTDTEDCSGKILSEKPVSVTDDEIREIIMAFVGEYDQVPPMYSAKKIGGKKLYELARQGIVVERKACPVKILDIHLEEIQLPRVIFTVTCSKGTYIRSLCRDIGEKAGCGGCMESLERIRVGPFTIDQAVTLSQIQARKEEGEKNQEDPDPLSGILLPIDRIFENLPRATVDQEGNHLLYNGNPLPVRFCHLSLKGDLPREKDFCQAKKEPCQAGNESDPAGDESDPVGKGKGVCQTEKRSGSYVETGKIRLYDSKGSFIGIYRQEGSFLKPVKLFFC